MNGNSEILETMERVPKLYIHGTGTEVFLTSSPTARHLNKEIKNICRRICGSIRKMKKWRNREAIATK
jgi:hypothetical protein